MDMWNWLLGCYKEGSVTIKELEEVMTDDEKCSTLYNDFIFCDPKDNLEWTRDQVKPFLRYIKAKNEI
jgi:hypothetical protein